MMSSWGAASQKPGGDFAEGHVGIGFHDLEAPIVDFLLELGLDGFGLPPVGSPGGILVTDSVPVKIRPPHFASFEQAHFVVGPPCWFSIQRMT
jgi:hypothetical protein